MCSVYESYGSIFCLISSLHPARRYILLRDLHQAPPSIQNSILAFCHQKWKRPASLVVPIHEISIREKRVKPSQGQLGLIRGLILCLFFDIIGGTTLSTWNFVNSDASKRHSKMEHLSKKDKYPVNHKSRWLEEGFRYRWLVVKEIGAAFSVSITLVFNHLRWNLSFSLNSVIFIQIVHFYPKSKAMSNQNE